MSSNQGNSHRMVVGILCLIVPMMMGCSRAHRSQTLDMPATPPLSARESYAVVEQAYSPLHDEPAAGSPILAQMRRGSVVEVTGRSAEREQLDGRYERWYRVRYADTDGWTFGGWIAVFETHGRARNFSEMILDD